MSILLNITKEYGVIMFKAVKNPKNYLSSNYLISKGMYKRRNLALAAISQIRNTRSTIRVVK